MIHAMFFRNLVIRGYHRIGLWENLQESPIFDAKNPWVSCKFSLFHQSSEGPVFWTSLDRSCWAMFFAMWSRGMVHDHYPWFPKRIDGTRGVGCATAVFRDGTVVGSWSFGVGVSDVQKGSGASTIINLYDLYVSKSHSYWVTKNASMHLKCQRIRRICLRLVSASQALCLMQIRTQVADASISWL